LVKVFTVLTARWCHPVRCFTIAFAVAAFAFATVGASAANSTLDQVEHWLAEHLPSFSDGCDSYDCVRVTRSYEVRNCSITIRSTFNSAQNSTGTVDATPVSTVRLFPRTGLALAKNIELSSNLATFPSLKLVGADSISLKNIDVGRIIVSTYDLADAPIEHSATVTMNAITPKIVIIPTRDADLARRLAEALREAAVLCGARNDTF
jgi:hypothetical protein